MISGRRAGIALVLVLLVTAVISLIILQVGLGARKEVELTRQLLNRAEAVALIRSREAGLLFSLLTQPMTRAADDSAPGSLWNFHGVPFDYQGVTVTIQDVNGLFVPAFSIERDREFERLMVFRGFSLGEAQDASDRLARYRRASIDKQPVQSLTTLQNIIGLSESRRESLEGLLTLYPTTFFNPATAPVDVLRLYYSDLAVASIASSRELSEMSSVGMNYVYSGSREVINYPGPALNVTIRARVGDAEVERSSIWVVKPWSDEPLRYWGPGR